MKDYVLQESPMINMVSLKKHEDLRLNSAKAKILSYIVQVRVPANDKELITCAKLDTGAECTLIEESVIEALDIEGHKKDIVLGTVRGDGEAFPIS